MEDTYFIISNSEGDTTVTQMNKTKLLQAIEENYWGEKECLNYVPENTDTNYWGKNLLIIKGSIVTPKPEKIVTKYNID